MVKKWAGRCFCKPNHGATPPPPLSFLSALKSRGIRSALWVIDAHSRATESILERTIGPMDRSLATPSLQFPGFWEVSRNFTAHPHRRPPRHPGSQFDAQRDGCWEKNEAEKNNSRPSSLPFNMKRGDFLEIRVAGNSFKWNLLECPT